ncbi:DUF6059 family protein [Streptomyces phaeochromogenes]
MKRLWCGGRQALADYCLRPLWRSLVLYGSIHVDPTVGHGLLASSSSPHAEDPFARNARGGTQLLPPGPDGPPPAHPERLCKDLPLSETERLLARELWPAYGTGRRAPDGG